MMRVRGQISLIGELFMTLSAGEVSAHALVQLIIGPLLSGSRIVGSLMHPMT
jgi:hypothetical protein